MRECGKLGCRGPAVATAALRYAERTLLVAPLTAEHEPNLLDLCEAHAARLSPPYGWSRLDARAETPAAAG